MIKLWQRFKAREQRKIEELATKIRAARQYAHCCESCGIVRRMPNNVHISEMSKEEREYFIESCACYKIVELKDDLYALREEAGFI